MQVYIADGLGWTSAQFKIIHEHTSGELPCSYHRLLYPFFCLILPELK